MGFAIGFGFLIYGIIAAYFLVKAAAGDGWIYGVLCFLMFGLLIGAPLQMAFNQSEKGPCVQYETQMHYNVATKTMMPARVCVLRGEWVDE